MNESKQTQRKFILASFFSLVGAGALFIGPRLSGGEYISLAALILGIYGGANVAEKILPVIFGNKKVEESK